MDLLLCTNPCGGGGGGGGIKATPPKKAGAIILFTGSYTGGLGFYLLCLVDYFFWICGFYSSEESERSGYISSRSSYPLFGLEVITINIIKYQYYIKFHITDFSL